MTTAPIQEAELVKSLANLPSRQNPMKFEISDIRLLEALEKKVWGQSWNAHVFTTEFRVNLPLRLSISMLHDDLLALIHGPNLTIGSFSHGMGGLQLAFDGQQKLAFAKIGDIYGDLPEDPMAQGQAVLDFLATKQRPTELTFARGSRQELLEITRAVTNLHGRSIAVRSAQVHGLNSTIYLKGAMPQMLNHIVDWFGPVGRAEAFNPNLDYTEGQLICAFDPEPISAHERLEAIDLLDRFMTKLESTGMINHETAESYRSEIPMLGASTN